MIIALHGLEGAADRPYIRGQISYFSERGWDGLGVNWRGCSGRINRLPRSYHMGATEDLKAVVDHAIQLGYRQIGIVGFSLGGNVLLKYLGEQGDAAPPQVVGGVAFSVPCHIQSANIQIDRRRNRLYRSRFLKSLNAKMIAKAALFPEALRLPARMPTTFAGFDDRFTGPLHGFRDAIDYWTQCSSINYLTGIRRLTLLVNAADDTFLSDECYPVAIAREQEFLHLEIPNYGGHVGFHGADKNGHYWSEHRTFEWLNNLLEESS